MSLKRYLDQWCREAPATITLNSVTSDPRVHLLACRLPIWTHLIIDEIHKRCGHQGVNGMLANLRQRFWIPFWYPLSPQLPSARTQPSRPFSHIGVDLAGPFRVADAERREDKQWVLLATCMVTRAVHFEIVNSLSAIQCVNALRRFIARRGKPTLILSDNASNFALGSDIISTKYYGCSIRSEILAESHPQGNPLQNFLTHETITWKFIAPLTN